MLGKDRARELLLFLLIINLLTRETDGLILRRPKALSTRPFQASPSKQCEGKWRGNILTALFLHCVDRACN
jgi:hypothetical protein